MNHVAHHEKKAPESLGWYIELVKWLIGIATATLVFGFDKLHLSGLGPALQGVFWVSAVLLAVSIGSGLLCCWLFLGYANRKESGLKAGETETTMTGYRDNGTTFYKICATSLWVGILLFGAVWMITLLGGREPQTAAAPLRVTLPEKSSALLIKPDQRGGSFVLTKNADGTYSWRAILAPDASAAPPAAGSQKVAPAAADSR